MLDSAKVAANDAQSVFNGDKSAFGRVSQHDLYVSPHFDDICFSLGAFADQRRQGILLTLFSNSIYAAKRMDAPRGSSAGRLAIISALRREEDAVFAQSVGLQQVTAGLDEASFRGKDVWNVEQSVNDAAVLNGQVIRTLAAAIQSQPSGPRPWLFCPMGIGGHVDHVTFLRIVINNYDMLQKSYRVAFYEDLHYASRWSVRVAGLARFRSLVAPLAPKRLMHLIRDTSRKLKLVSIYESQFAQPPTSISRFTPKLIFPAPAHEAIWTMDSDGN